MPRLAHILTKDELDEFDYPPILKQESKALCFTLNNQVKTKINKLRTATSKVGFVLQYGYFKACKHFFVSNRFRQEDIEYVAKLLGVPIRNINFSKYKKKLPVQHQAIILQLLNYNAFDEKVNKWLTKEVIRRVEYLIDPRQLFFELLQLLHDQHVEIPSFHLLADLITKHYSKYENKLLLMLSKTLSLKRRKILDSLLEVPQEQSKSLLNSFKVINQATKPKAIQASLNVYNTIDKIFHIILAIIKELKLNQNSCEYYATWVKNAKLSQIKQFSNVNKTYLYLVAFIRNQIYLRQDTFVDILLKCVQSVKNTSLKRLNELDKLSRSERKSAIQHLTKANHSNKALIDEITSIVRSAVLTDPGKVKRIEELITRHEKQKNAVEQHKIELFEKSLEHMSKDKDYFDILEKLSIKLQRRVSGIIQVLIFNTRNSDKTLMEAIEYFKVKNGQIDNKAPIDFLKKDEQMALTHKNGLFRTSLYKALLFIHVADAIRSGELNLKYSYRYLSIKEYLIDEKTWHKDRKNLLRLADLEEFAKHDITINTLKQLLHDKYKAVNQRYLEGRNPYLSIDEAGYIKIATPALDERETKFISALLEQVSYVPILQVLTQINEITKFSKCLKHHNIKHAKGQPRPEVFNAGIIGLGCNIGIPKMAQISKGINENTLLNTATWYLSLKNLIGANERIIEYINKLTLPTIFIADQNAHHSSSDGSKLTVGIESLIANYSFKYFGRDKGVSVYTFIDERHVLFHSLVMSSSEREAAYVIDGLHDNKVIKTDIHSTDTHGYTEVVFGTTHFMHTTFAPRLKNIAKQTIYAFSSKKTYEKLGYKILPSRTINQKIIETHWEDILRFMATIKLKHTSASQLLKRLSSYAKDNPLHKAIKEFGRIIKSIFILTYLDDVKLRQRIEKQLNRGESSNKFSDAVFYAQNGEFKKALREEQEIATACKVLIQNAIMLWNYLYISQLLVNCIDEKERHDMISMIKDGSIMSWRHINLHGEFDFTRHVSNDDMFNLNKILKLKMI